VVRVFEEFANGVSPGQIARRLNAEGVSRPAAANETRSWTPTLSLANACRASGILNDVLYTRWRPHQEQTYRKTPTPGGGGRALIRNHEGCPGLVATPDFRIVFNGFGRR
jgi:site-specific DNA recombinase